MDLKKLLDAALASGIPELIESARALAIDTVALISLAKANHDRAGDMLKFGTPEEIEAVHVETLALIDAFDAELAQAAAR